MTSTTRDNKDNRRHRIEKAGAVIFALSIWQMGAMLLNESLLLVTPLTVLRRLLTLCTEADFLSAVGFSFIRIVFGFLLGLLTASLLAVIAGRFYLAEVMFWPFMVTIKSVPVASFIILCLIWLSSQNLSTFISFLMVLPIVYTNMLQGIKSTDTKLLEMATVFQVGWPKRMKYIHLPHLKPYLISASSVSIGLSWKAGIAAEVIGIPDGSIGEKLYEAKVYLSSGDLFAWTLVIILISISFEKIFLRLLNSLFAKMEGS
ncbi:MAG: ABC transporter permease subunit [Clostridia bacterium]|nr:ABC transporter permease subunit [Clostridia bacterium]